MWPTFKPNEEGLIDTWEPKFSNNVGTFKLRPNVKTSIDNLYFATAYTHNSSHIFNMEGACESGLKAVNEILQKEGLKTREIYTKKRRILPWVLGPFRGLDKAMYKIGLPHLSTFTGGALPMLGLTFAGLLYGAYSLM